MNKVLLKHLKNITTDAAIHKQRSPEWYEQRKTTIGGSEISIVLGDNPFTSKVQLLSRKLGIDTFEGNIYTQWGTIFEEHTTQYAKAVLKMQSDIYETGSISGKIKGQRYSPDGLGVVTLLDIDNKPCDCIILFEFKAPSGTSFTKKDIPKHYLDQVLTGLMTLDFTDAAIFISNYYRKCSFDQFNYTGEYDKEFHKSDYRARKHGLSKEEPYALGVIAVFKTKKQHKDVLEFFSTTNTNNSALSDSDFDLLYDNKGLIDFGKAPRCDITRIFQLESAGVITFKNFKMIINYPRVNLHPFLMNYDISHDKEQKDLSVYIENIKNKFNEICTKRSYKPIGLLPWKLMFSQIKLVHRRDDWLSIIKEPVKNFLKELKEFQSEEDPKEAFISKYNIIEDMDEFDMDDLAPA